MPERAPDKTARRAIFRAAAGQCAGRGKGRPDKNYYSMLLRPRKVEKRRKGRHFHGFFALAAPPLPPAGANASRRGTISCGGMLPRGWRRCACVPCTKNEEKLHKSDKMLPVFCNLCVFCRLSFAFCAGKTAKSCRFIHGRPLTEPQYLVIIETTQPHLRRAAALRQMLLTDGAPPCKLAMKKDLHAARAEKGK